MTSRRPGQTEQPLPFPLRHYCGATWLAVNVRKDTKCCICAKAIPKKARAWFPVIENIALGVIRGNRMCCECMERVGRQPSKP